MLIIPAIDIYQGQCVRLYKGDFNTAKIYASDPLQLAEDYQAQGATDCHIVDLDGAKLGQFACAALLSSIQQSLSLKIQVGGGLRDPAHIESVLALGIDRVILGSLAVQQPTEVQALIRDYGTNRIVLALDVNVFAEPMVAIQGWQKTATTSLWSLLEKYQDYQGLNILCTDIGRDGTLEGPNFVLYAQCIKRFPQFNWQASGGIHALQDLTQLQALGMAACIVGKALYEKKFTLSAALAEVE